MALDKTTVALCGDQRTKQEGRRGEGRRSTGRARTRASASAGRECERHGPRKARHSMAKMRTREKTRGSQTRGGGWSRMKTICYLILLKTITHSLYPTQKYEDSSLIS